MHFKYSMNTDSLKLSVRVDFKTKIPKDTFLLKYRRYIDISNHVY